MRDEFETKNRMEARRAAGASTEELEEYERVLGWMRAKVPGQELRDRIAAMGLQSLQYTVDQARWGSPEKFELVMRRYIALVWLRGKDSAFLEDGPDPGDCSQLCVIFGLPADMWGADKPMPNKGGEI